MRRLALAVLALAALSSPVQAAEAEPVARIEIIPESKAQFLEMAALGLDIQEAEGQAFVAFARPEQLARLQQLGIPYSVDIPDMAEYYASQYAEPTTMGGYRTFSEIITLIDSLSSAYPGICSPKFSIGQSIEGRDLWVVKVSDNWSVDEDEPEVFWNSLIHAREPGGAEALLRFLIYLLENYGVDSEVTDVVDNRELFFLPVFNPDGYVYNETTNPSGGGMWRKNRRALPDLEFGIDLNRNWGYEWGYDDFGSTDDYGSDLYRGSGPFSEPETQAVRDFVISHQFVMCNNFHTHGDLFLWPYGYDRVYTPYEKFYATLGDSIAQYNGYTPEVSWGLYPANGVADDWMFGDTISKPRILSITTEIGPSFWPSVGLIDQLADENIMPNFFLAKTAGNPLLLGPPNPPVVSVADSSPPTYTVDFPVQDSINPPVTYRLFELSQKSTETDDAESEYGYWETARFSRTTARKHLGNFSWHSINSNREHHWLRSVTPYIVKPDDTLRFWTWFSIEPNYDYFYVQISTDGGFSFENLANDLTTNTSPFGLNLGNGITGESGGWVEAEFDLSAYEGEQVIFRFSQFTDYFTLYEGVYLDDIENVDVYGSEVEILPMPTSPSHDFTNHTLGEYCYRASAIDAEGQESYPSKLAFTTVYEPGCCDGRRGDVNLLGVFPGEVDSGDLGVLVNFLFSPPGSVVLPCEEEADVDGSGGVNPVDSSDLGALVNFLFAEPGTVSLLTCP